MSIDVSIVDEQSLITKDTTSSSSSSTFSPLLKPKHNNLKIIITGATGFVGEGVVLATLAHPAVAKVLIVTRQTYTRSPGKGAAVSEKLQELVVPDFLKLGGDGIPAQLSGYDACFYCAGRSAQGMTEEEYTKLTYETVMHFAGVLVELNPGMVFCHLSGALADSTEKGKQMWARVKGRAENALVKMPFGGVYNFRPGLMKAANEQQHVSGLNKVLSGVMYPLLHLLAPGYSCTMADIAHAMISCVLLGNEKHVLEVVDIKAAAKRLALEGGGK